MKVIVGLGNPGAEYRNTRHNAGFLAIDEIVAKRPDLKYTNSKKWVAEVWQGPELLLIKPQTFMNNSGQAVRAIIEYYHKSWLAHHSELKNLYVMHDDLDLELGHVKVQFDKGPKVHNGLLSLEQHLKTSAFWHVRIGIDGRQGDRSLPGSAYVLQAFQAEEWSRCKPALTTVLDQIL
ncbi:MAG TPA: aminoacyl-tRNA hydrolase [Vitreimonas sp.]|nr:aminoacyl-tRNA hydrolase [Vitreimonas sp.]